MKIFSTISIILLFIFIQPTICFSDDNIEEQLTKTAETLRKSVVQIHSKQKYIFEFSDSSLPQAEKEKLKSFFGALKKISRGSSGVIWSEDGHIVTVGDAIANADEIEVELFDGTKYKAEKVGFDEKTNIGVLKIPVKTAGQKINFDVNFKPKVGSFVVAVGNPFGLKGSVSVGIVSGLNRTLVSKSGAARTGLIQITAPVNPGDAGGVLATKDGKVIGIISSTYEKIYRRHDKDLSNLIEQFKDLLNEKPDASAEFSNLQKMIEFISKAKIKWDEILKEGSETFGLTSFFSEGINFATSIDTVAFVVDELIKNGKVNRGWLGIFVEELPSSLRKHFGLNNNEGVLIVNVLHESPAFKAGFKEYDIILQCDDKTINGLAELEKIITRSHKGKTINFTIIRKGKKVNLNTTLGDLKEEK